MTTLGKVVDALYSTGKPMSGSDMSDDEALAYARQLPHGNYCLVRNWRWFDLEVTESQRQLLAKTRMRIPRSSGHPFHEHLTTDSTVIRPPIPRASGH